MFNIEAGDTIASISLGGSSSFAISSNGRVFTWGFNYGQLGDGTTVNILTPTEITNRFNLTNSDKIVSISSGGAHSSAVSSNGRVFTWGYNPYGALGDGTTIDKTTPTEITSRFNLSFDEKISFTYSGISHSSALSSSGRVFTWGSNYGAIGDGTTENRLTPTEITNRFTLTNFDNIVSISSGGDSASAVSLNGRVFTWGANNNGTLGDGTNFRKLVPNDISSKFYLSK
jgi:alpha-tubulin suppressor-like RCC1 family protein